MFANLGTSENLRLDSFTVGLTSQSHIRAPLPVESVYIC
ncbi:hypothetical protein HDG33_001330 [Paraburkholderia sp. Cpub6]|nr:hypothetical protein [Paraburkholderia sp. Cpub6]